MGGQSSAIKSVFSHYNVSHSGMLDVSEILAIKELQVSGKKFNFADCHSLVLLFMFDQSQQGSLNLREFERILKFFEKKKKQAPKKPQNSPRIFTTVNSENKNSFDLDRDSGTQMITGKISATDQNCPQSNLQNGLGEIPKTNNKTHTKDSIDLEQSSEHEILQLLKVEAIKFLSTYLQRKDGEKKFIQWLWNLANIEKNAKISLEELSKILTLLTNDGFVISTLFFDEKPRDTISAKEIMEEYDIGKTGYLDYDEFFKLADLIYRNYVSMITVGDKEYGRYKIVRKLASGSVGTVYLAIDQITKEQKALKVIPKNKHPDLTKIDSEIKAMLMLDHPNILQLHEVLETSDSDIVFVMELCDEFWLPNNEDEVCARFYFKQLISAVAHCHERGVCHRDIKPENLLLDNECNLKVSDFGHAGIYSVGWDIFSSELVGTLIYLAPEQLTGQAYGGEKVDVWSCGVVLYVMVTGKRPFEAKCIDEFLKKVENSKFEIEGTFSKELVDLLNGILVKDPAKRISLKKIAAHPWLQGEAKKPDFKQAKITIHSKHSDIRSKLLKILTKLDIHFVEKDQSTLNCSAPSHNVKFYIQIQENHHDNEYEVELQCFQTSGSRKSFGFFTSSIKSEILIFAL